MRLSPLPVQLPSSSHVTTRRMGCIPMFGSKTVSMLAFPHPSLAGHLTVANSRLSCCWGGRAASAPKEVRKHAHGSTCCSATSAIEYAGAHSTTSSSPALVTLSRAAKECMLRAEAEARQMGCKEVHPAHVLLGCMRLGQDVARKESSQAESCSEVGAQDCLRCVQGTV
jgi:hypothetical protein